MTQSPTEEICCMAEAKIQPATGAAPPASGPAAPAARERVTLPITGMTCAACAARIEKVLARQEGVGRASVNFATHRASVEYDPARVDTFSLVELIRQLGYGTAETSEARFYVNDSECMNCTTPMLEEAVRRVPGVLEAVYNPAIQQVIAQYV